MVTSSFVSFFDFWVLCDPHLKDFFSRHPAIKDGCSWPLGPIYCMCKTNKAHLCQSKSFPDWPLSDL